MNLIVRSLELLDALFSRPVYLVLHQFAHHLQCFYLGFLPWLLPTTTASFPTMLQEKNLNLYQLLPPMESQLFLSEYFPRDASI